MALLRFSPEFDPVSNLLVLQNELERYLRNPAIRVGVSGPATSHRSTYSMTETELS
jgi:hypothetical protein